MVKYATDITAQAIARKKAENARGLIESVAAGSEEMSASIREISETMTKSKANARRARPRRVEAADVQAQKLNAAAQAMSGIVELIGNITGQINLLALNATIESARAGEAGRGFAVVASEVKNLANQAKQATDTISKEIEQLNGIAGDVVGLAHRHQGRDRQRQRVHRLDRRCRGRAEHRDRGHVVQHAARLGRTGLIRISPSVSVRPAFDLPEGQRNRHRIRASDAVPDVFGDSVRPPLSTVRYRRSAGRG